MKPRPTEAEFDELKRKRAEAMLRVRERIAEKWGVNPRELHMHDCGAGACYCACPDGPCQHTWDGPEYTEPNMSSVTCSRCGEPAIYHDMRVILATYNDAINSDRYNDQQANREANARLIAAAPTQDSALNYVADNTYCGVDGEWHFKPGYDPRIVLDALACARGES